MRAALTHPSLSGPKREAARRLRHRLQLLGDAVWSVAVVHALLGDAEAPRADLAHRKAQLAGAPFMAQVARRAGLGRVLRLGAGPEAAQLRERDSVLAETLEALLGAWYLQAGLSPVLRFVRGALRRAAREGWLPRALDAKSELQQVLTRRYRRLPVYRVVELSGRPHAPEFLVEVSLGDRPLGRGRGGSRRAAEQMAARAALEALHDTGTGHNI